MGLFALSAYRGHYSTPNSRRLLPGGLIGIACGAMAFGVLDEKWLRVLVGAMAVAFVVQWLLGLKTMETRRTVGGVFWGAVGGFTGTFARGRPPGVDLPAAARASAIAFRWHHGRRIRDVHLAVEDRCSVGAGCVLRGAG